MHQFNRLEIAGVLPFTLVAMLALTLQSDALARKWTSASGQFSVEAELVEVREGNVVLKKENGKQITVPLDKLSAADRQYIASLNARPPSGSPPPRDAPAPRGQAPQRPRRQFKWETTERLLLPADEAVKADDGEVWVNNDGRHVAYVRKQGEKECLVVDGKAEPLHDRISTCNIWAHAVWFGGGDHYAYCALDGDEERFVVDGKEERAYANIDTRYACLGETEHTWSYVAWQKDTPPRLVTEGSEVCDVPPTVLLVEHHSLAIDLSGSRWWAEFDGKPEKHFDYINDKSLLLHGSGSHGYIACDKIGDGYYVVVNGNQSPKYDYVSERYNLTFSNDGKHYAYTARRGKKGVLMVDGQEHPTSASTSSVRLSGDGQHWACQVGKEVILDGRVTVTGHDDYNLYGVCAAFSPDGSRFACCARRETKNCVVLDGVDQPPFHEVRNLSFSSDGARLAYVAKLADKGPECVVVDGKAGKSYDRVSGGTINFGLDGECLSYIVKLGSDDKYDAGVLVIDGQERTKYDKIAPKPSQTLHIGTDTLEYVAVRDGAYYWVTEKRSEK